MIEERRKKQEAGSWRKGVLPAFAFTILLSPFFLLPASSRAYTSPGKPTGFVNDFAGVLSASDKETIETELQALQKSTSAQVVVATITSLGDETIDSYAVDLFQEWGIGQKGKDNGLLVLVAPNDHEARIEVGYGLEGDVTDLQAGNIVRDVMIPAFKNNEYASGIKGGVDAVAGLVVKSPDAVQYDEPVSKGENFGSNLPVIFFIGVILLNALARILGKTTSWWLGGVIGAVVGVIAGFAWGFIPIGIIAIIVLTILGLIFDYIVSKHPPGPGRGPGGFWPIFFLGGGRGGFGGGGFGGFGGGRSGGGGASGGW